MDLLDKAKAYKSTKLRKHSFDSAHDALLMAWAKSEITDTQAAHALDKDPKNVHHIMSSILRDAVQNGRLKITVCK